MKIRSAVQTLTVMAIAGALTLGAVSATEAGSGKRKVVMIGTGIVHNTAGDRSAAVKAMDSSLRRQLESKGYTVQMVPARPGKTLLTDAQLATIGKQNRADYVLYPKILSLGHAKDAVASPSRTGSYATLYARVIDPNKRSRDKSVYFRQIGHHWDRAPANVDAYTRGSAFPEGASKVLQYFRAPRR